MVGGGEQIPIGTVTNHRTRIDRIALGQEDLLTIALCIVRIRVAGALSGLSSEDVDAIEGVAVEVIRHTGHQVYPGAEGECHARSIQCGAAGNPTTAGRSVLGYVACHHDVRSFSPG